MHRRRAHLDGVAREAACRPRGLRPVRGEQRRQRLFVRKHRDRRHGRGRWRVQAITAERKPCRVKLGTYAAGARRSHVQREAGEADRAEHRPARPVEGGGRKVGFW